MKKISLIICILVLLLTGCNKKYEYKENNAINETTENNKETSNNKHNSFSMTTALLVESKADDMWMPYLLPLIVPPFIAASVHHEKYIPLPPLSVTLTPLIEGSSQSIIRIPSLVLAFTVPPETVTS